MTIADAVWLSTALLHMEHAQASDFSVGEIIEKAVREQLVDGFKPGLQVHASKHCVANKSPNPGRYRMLFETTRGRRRLFKDGDPCHRDREGGRVKPAASDLPAQYLGALRWYEKFYNRDPRLRPRIDFMASAKRDSLVEVTDTVERMSARQLEELRTYIISKYSAAREA